MRSRYPSSKGSDDQAITYYRFMTFPSSLGDNDRRAGGGRAGSHSLSHPAAAGADAAIDAAIRARSRSPAAKLAPVSRHLAAGLAHAGHIADSPGRGPAAMGKSFFDFRCSRRRCGSRSNSRRQPKHGGHRRRGASRSSGRGPLPPIICATGPAWRPI